MNNKPPLLKWIFIVWSLSVFRICKGSYAHYEDMDKFVIDFNKVNKNDSVDEEVHERTPINLHQFQEDNLECHNHFRRFHNAPPLSQNPNLNDFAQYWARTMVNSKKFKHSESPFGETIFATTQSRLAGSSACFYIYKQGKNYIYSNYHSLPKAPDIYQTMRVRTMPSMKRRQRSVIFYLKIAGWDDAVCGSESRVVNDTSTSLFLWHSSTDMFTQMIWKATIWIGFGYSKRENISVIVLEYYPKGNIDGLYNINVSPIITSRAMTTASNIDIIRLITMLHILFYLYSKYI